MISLLHSSGSIIRPGDANSIGERGIGAWHDRRVPTEPQLEPHYLPLDGLDGGRFHATFSTTGPWFADAQHAGPPSALLIRALERCDARPGTVPALVRYGDYQGGAG